MIKKENRQRVRDIADGIEFETFEVGDITVYSFPLKVDIAFAFTAKGKRFLALDENIPEARQDRIISHYVATGTFEREGANASS